MVKTCFIGYWKIVLQACFIKDIKRHHLKNLHFMPFCVHNSDKLKTFEHKPILLKTFDLIHLFKYYWNNPAIC